SSARNSGPRRRFAPATECTLKVVVLQPSESDRQGTFRSWVSRTGPASLERRSRLIPGPRSNPPATPVIGPLEFIDNAGEKSVCKSARGARDQIMLQETKYKNEFHRWRASSPKHRARHHSRSQFKPA